jgi:hypothetical protein
VYDKTDKVILVGDSFTHGACVKEGDDIAGLLRHKGVNAINMGMGGNSELSKLATLKEYGVKVKPNIVLWMFTIGELAGFLQGDIILKVNGVDAMSSFYVMRETIYAFPGDIWTVEFKRDGEVMTKKIALREMDRTQLIKTLNLRAK